MASRFWVSGTGSWDATTTHWSATTGGASGASVPTTTDDVFIDANSGVGTITLASSPSIQGFDCTGYTGTFSFGTGALTMTVTGSFLLNATMSVTSNGSQSLVLNSGVSGKSFNNFGKNCYGTGILSFGTNNVFTDFILDNTALTTGNRTLSLTGNQTVNGQLNINASGNTNSGLRITSNTVATGRTITLGASSTVTLNTLLFEDITFSGTGVPVSGTKLGNVGNNSGITFASPVTYYWIGATGNYNDTTKWSLTSGGAAAGVYPLVHDLAVFDANSFSAASQSFTLNTNYLCDLDFTNVTNNPALALTNPNGAGNLFCGSLRLKSGMTNSGSATGWNFRGRRATTVTQAGVTLGSVSSISFRTAANTVTLGSDFSLNAQINNAGVEGSINANGFNFTCTTFNYSGTPTRTLTMGSGTWTLTGTGTVWNFGTDTNCTLNPGTSTLVVSDTSATAKTVTMGAATATLYNLSITGGGTGTVTLLGSTTRTFNNLTIGAPKNIILTAGATRTINGTFTALGSVGNIISIVSSIAGTQATLSKVSGTVSSDYLSLQDSVATGGATWYAGANSTNVSNNTGWVFTAPPSTSNTGLLLCGVG